MLLMECDAPSAAPRAGIKKLLLLAAILAAFCVAFQFLPVKNWLESYRAFIVDTGWTGRILYVLGYALFAMILFPCTAMTFLAASSFGLLEGFLLAVVGSNLGALGAFVLARGALRGRVEAWAAANPRFLRVDEAISQRGFVVVTLLRLTPIVPYTLLNYYLGLTRISTLRYIAGTLIGMLPVTLAVSYVASLSVELAAGVQDRVKLGIYAAGFAATLAVTIVITRLARRALREIDAPIAKAGSLGRAAVRRGELTMSDAPSASGANGCALSIIIPVLNDASALRRSLEALAVDCGSDANIETIVIDGGNDAAASEIARGSGAAYLRAERGRATQMNAGAARARGEWLWFLHADCIPSAGSLAALKSLDAAARWGCFRHRIDAPSLALRVIERADNFRARWLRMPYGDQGLFVRRADFERVGRFATVPLLEDVLLARALGKIAAPRVLRPVLKSDARRWLQRGIFATTWLNWKIMWQFLIAGKSPSELASLYRSTPESSTATGAERPL